jgi:hypothetical protein
LPTGLHDETCDVLMRDHLSDMLYGAALRTKAPPIEWHFQGDGASVPAAVATLEDAYSDAHLFETICQIRGDEVDGAGTHEL